jgi:hypothetical protein
VPEQPTGSESSSGSKDLAFLGYTVRSPLHPPRRPFTDLISHHSSAATKATPTRTASSSSTSPTLLHPAPRSARLAPPTFPFPFVPARLLSRRSFVQPLLSVAYSSRTRLSARSSLFSNDDRGQRRRVREMRERCRLVANLGASELPGREEWGAKSSQACRLDDEGGCSGGFSLMMANARNCLVTHNEHFATSSTSGATGGKREPTSEMH